MRELYELNLLVLLVMLFYHLPNLKCHFGISKFLLLL